MSWLTIHLDDATLARLDSEAAAVRAKYPAIPATREQIAQSMIALALDLRVDAAPATAVTKRAPVFSTGTRLRALRKSLGLTLKQFATNCGASSAATISALELGQRTPGFKLALAIEAISGGSIKVEEFGFDRETARRKGALK